MKKFDYYTTVIYIIICIFAITYYVQQNLPEIAVLWLGFGTFHVLNDYRNREISKIKEEKHKELLRHVENGGTVDWKAFNCKYL